MSAAAGWYPDPQGAPTTERYWDGMSWTNHTRPRAAMPPPPPAMPQQSAPQYLQPVSTQSESSGYGGAFANASQAQPRFAQTDSRSHAAPASGFVGALREFFSIRDSGTEGRAPRDQWLWTNFVIATITQFVIYGAWSMFASYVVPPSDSYEFSDAGGVVYLVGLLLYIVLLSAVGAQWLCVSIRRLHDTGRRGTYMFMGLIPFVGPLILLHRLGFLAGDARRNRFDEEYGKSFWVVFSLVAGAVVGCYVMLVVGITGYKAAIDRTNQSSAVTSAQSFSRELNSLASNGDIYNNNPNDTDPRKPHLLLELVAKGDVPDQYTMTSELGQNQVRVLMYNPAGAGAGQWTRLFCQGTTASAGGNTPCPTVSSSLTSASLIASTATPYAGTWVAGHLQNPTRATGPANTPNPSPICLQFHKAGQDAYLNVSQYANTPGVVSTDISVACPSAAYGNSAASAPTAVTAGTGYVDLSTTMSAGITAADPTW